jgi:hypothetical protein
MRVRHPVRIAASTSWCKSQALHARFSNKKGRSSLGSCLTPDVTDSIECQLWHKACVSIKCNGLEESITAQHPADSMRTRALPGFRGRPAITAGGQIPRGSTRPGKQPPASVHRDPPAASSCGRLVAPPWGSVLISDQPAKAWKRTSMSADVCSAGALLQR